MNWIIITFLSLLGAIMGFLSIKGYTQKLEPVLWLLFAVISALLLSKNVSQKTFLHGLVIGLAWGIFNGLIQSSFFDQYLTNNPRLQDNFKKITFIKARYFPLITGPIIGAITGAVLGGLTLLLKKIID